MVNDSSADVYEQIFAGVGSRSELAQAIARAVRQLREAMEKEDKLCGDGGSCAEPEGD